jgi:hypothetical protein
MASGITYNGVPSEEGGKLFKDVKFWVAQRVPMRSTWVELIRVSHLPSFVSLRPCSRRHVTRQLTMTEQWWLSCPFREAG